MAHVACSHVDLFCTDVGLVPSKEGYHAIKLQGCEFLLATTADGRLDLSDVYVQVYSLFIMAYSMHAEQSAVLASLSSRVKSA